MTKRIFRPVLGVLLVIAALVGCGGYAPGRNTYWDAQVRELCEKEAGITVYERVTISKSEYESLGGRPGGLPLPPEWMRPEFPYFIELKITKINDANPEVGRTETVVKRRLDKKALGKATTFFRKGGDIPTGLFHESSFSCSEKARDLMNRIFDVQ